MGREGVKNIYKGRVVDLEIEDVLLPNGSRTQLEIIRHSGASAIVPLKEDGSILLIRQFRYAAGGYIFEIPAGRLNKGEDPLACAERELEEEIGYKARHLKQLLTIFTTPGFTDERIYIFLAQGLIKTRQNLESDEVIEVIEMPLLKAIEMVKEGGICDGKTIAGLFATYLGDPQLSPLSPQP